MPNKSLMIFLWRRPEQAWQDCSLQWPLCHLPIIRLKSYSLLSTPTQIWAVANKANCLMKDYCWSQAHVRMPKQDLHQFRYQSSKSRRSLVVCLVGIIEYFIERLLNKFRLLTVDERTGISGKLWLTLKAPKPKKQFRFRRRLKKIKDPTTEPINSGLLKARKNPWIFLHFNFQKLFLESQMAHGSL